MASDQPHIHKKKWLNRQPQETVAQSCEKEAQPCVETPQLSESKKENVSLETRREEIEQLSKYVLIEDDPLESFSLFHQPMDT